MFGMSRAPERLDLGPNGWVPNNLWLPVLLYRHAFGGDGAKLGDVAGQMETAFTRNGWPPQWRNGVYGFHHYHSTAHELLGFARGWGRLVLGGEGGREIVVNAGDVAVLPAGTGHCRVAASEDFLVVGAYPPGETWDVCRDAPDKARAQRMRDVVFPASDPVVGVEGPLVKAWL